MLNIQIWSNTGIWASFLAACASVGHFFLSPSNRSPASQLALFRNPLVLLVQILDPIFELAVGALWQTCGYHVGTGRRILAVLSWR
jgi:hypothetical protein